MDKTKKKEKKPEQQHPREIEDEYEEDAGVTDDEKPLTDEEDEAMSTSGSETDSDDEPDLGSDDEEEEDGSHKKKKGGASAAAAMRFKTSPKGKKAVQGQVYSSPEELLAAVEEEEVTKGRQRSGEAAQIPQPAELKGVSMRDYQLESLAWLADLHEKGHGGILADEMGLGKTLQSIAFLLHLRAFGDQGPYLIVMPLSVLDNWQTELARFAPSLKVLVYVGEKDRRQELREEVVAFVNELPKAQRAHPTFTFQVVLTTYETLNMDIEFLTQFSFTYMIVDEAARLKNSSSLLYQNLEQFDCPHRLLLTGTPVQNNLAELHSLLNFVRPGLFGEADSFQRWFSPKQGDGALRLLHRVIKPFLLRRLKEEVVKELPQKREFTLYVGLSALQKEMYKGVLTRDTSAFDGKNKTSLMNILAQLRKVVNHPYLFDGVEPEPFELGDHLVNASGKLAVLDTLLPYLKRKGHRILLFSQMTRVLDIIQDYLFFRGYSYERLDGSVRGEERFLAIKNFNADPETFVFLLSTRAGGVGLNLTAADTVIFFDSDFNPQADLQAAARSHRLGQTKEVQVIRLICRDTVEEIILRRANRKLRLSSSVMTVGLFGGKGDAAAAAAKSQAAFEKWQSPDELLNILKFGMDALLENLGDDKKLTDADFDQIFRTKPEDLRGPDDATEDDLGDEDQDEATDTTSTMYIFKGEDYSSPKAKKSTRQKADDEAFGKLADEARKNTATQSPKGTPPKTGRPPKAALSPEELEQLREEAELRKLQKRAADEQKRAEKRVELWKHNKYHSSSLPLPPAATIAFEEAEEQPLERGSKGKEREKEEPTERAINYVTGDVTQPEVFAHHPAEDTTAIVVNCVDNSGSWGSGGVFSSLNRLSPFIGAKYEAAGENDDLQLGDAHLEKLELLEGGLSHPGKLWVVNIVAQKRDKKGVSGVQLPALEEAFRKISHVAKEAGASVHFPRIGQKTPNFNWYGTERLVRKWFCAKGIPTYIYYFSRKRRHGGGHDDEGSSSLSAPFHSPPATQSLPTYDHDSDFDSVSPLSSSKKARVHEVSTQAAAPAASLSLEGSPLVDIFTDMRFLFVKVAPADVQALSRKVIAFDGEVADELDQRVTHILYADEGVDDDGLALAVTNPSVKLLTVSWLKDSLAAKKALDPRPYSLVE